ncbi:MAG TPA: AAA family ATPase [Polyangiaceae bacterium]
MSGGPRFDQALAGAVAWARAHPELGADMYLIRDVHGRVRVLAQTPPGEAAADDLHRALGAFSPGRSSLFLDGTLFTPEELARDRAPVTEGVWLIDRLVSEQGWRRPSVAKDGHKPRVTFFGIKGGVGRSTALVALAKRLAEKGRRVLVVDLDLESPGTTSMLLAPSELPAYGVVDWFVEDAVGQGDDELLRGMVNPSRVGEILVTPSLGTTSVPDDRAPSLRDGGFVAKLGRVYASPDGSEFATRLERLLEGLERVHEPDVVLLDSRAGLHDVSAAAVPRLGGTALLFAGATSQTWLGYRLLFSAWARDREVLEGFRDRLRVVASLVPETGREAYVDRVRLSAYDLFSSFVYDSSENEDALLPDVRDPDAPHAPIPIFWRREFVECEPAAPPGATNEGMTPEQFDAAFAPYLRAVGGLREVAHLFDEDP